MARLRFSISASYFSLPSIDLAVLIRPLRPSRDHQNVKGRTHTLNAARDCRAVMTERCHAKQSPGLRAFDGIEPPIAREFSVVLVLFASRQIS